MLGGVAAGLADYLDIDPLIVRIGFVVLAFVGGSGLLLYGAGWLLIPADDTGRAVVQDFVERRPHRRSLVAIVVGVVIAVIALSNLFSSGPWRPRWDGGIGGGGFFFGLGALALAAVLLVASGRRGGSPLRWMLLTTLVAVAAMAVVAIATVFSVEALSGVPLRGGVGNTQWRPTSAAQVLPRYRLAIGNIRVDLSDVAFRPGTTDVTASVGIGTLTVDVPTGPTVSVRTRTPASATCRCSGRATAGSPPTGSRSRRGFPMASPRSPTVRAAPRRAPPDPTSSSTPRPAWARSRSSGCHPDGSGTQDRTTGPPGRVETGPEGRSRRCTGWRHWPAPGRGPAWPAYLLGWGVTRR